MPVSPDPAGSPVRGQLHPKYVKSERLGRRIMEYKAWINAAEYKWLTMVHEFDHEGLWQLEGIRSCAHWLNYTAALERRPGEGAGREGAAPTAEAKRAVFERRDQNDTSGDQTCFTDAG